MDEGSLGGLEEFRRVWVVGDEEVGETSDDDGRYALEDETAFRQYDFNQAGGRACYIQFQPSSPPTPSINPIPYARIPPKAPARAAAEKNSATRNWRSLRWYLCKRKLSTNGS